MRGILGQNRKLFHHEWDDGYVVYSGLHVLNDQGIVFRFLAWLEICLYCQSFIPAGFYPSSYSVFTGDSSSGVKAAGV